MHGFFKTELSGFLNNIHINERNIYLVRHGATENDEKGILGSESKLTDRGIYFTKQIRELFREKYKKTNHKLWIFGDLSESIRESLQYFSNEEFCSEVRMNISVDCYISAIIRTGGRRFHKIIVKKMNKFNRYQAIVEKHEIEFEARTKDKFNYRYPGVGGESYFDVIERLKPIITELESRREDVLIISHTAVMRTILGYYRSEDLSKIPFIKIDNNLIYKISPHPYIINENTIEVIPNLLR